ncbi:MAG: rnhA operon protein [Halanaeroarchaeum sp.]
MAEDDTPPPDVIEEAERLTRLARRATDDAEAAAYRDRRETVLAEEDFVARVREDDDGATLVCHPAEWVDEEGVVDLDAVEDLGRGVEVSLSGADAGDGWAETDAHNRAHVEAVRERHGDRHAENARAFADFMGNHYAAAVEDATGRQIGTFLREYYPRNAWPSGDAAASVNRSVRLLLETARERASRARSGTER